MSRTLRFKNQDLVTLGNGLNEFKLKGKASIGRSRLVSKMNDKVQEFNEDRTDIQRHYFKEDKEHHEFLKDENNQLIPLPGADLDQGTVEMQDLGKTEAVIDFTEYSEKMIALLKGLENYPYELSGQEAIIFDIIYEQLEKTYGNDKEAQ